jgi:hypothetical protein
MNFNIQIDVLMDAKTEEAATLALFEFLRYSEAHCGSDYGFVEWELLEFIPTENDETLELGI